MNRSTLEKLNFTGYFPIEQLRKNIQLIPDQPGVYVLITPNPSQKRFLEKGSGGYFKGKEPNISLFALEKEWVQGAEIVYIGKAGGSSSKSTLRKRLKQYFDFGAGKVVGHYGGRLVWQLAESESLIVAWLPCLNIESSTLESNLINEFKNAWGQRPFANLKD